MNAQLTTPGNRDHQVAKFFEFGIDTWKLKFGRNPSHQYIFYEKGDETNCSNYPLRTNLISQG
jgi:hypothetical protein